MVINGLSQAALIAQIMASKRNTQPKDSSADQSDSAQAADVKAERNGTALLNHVRILSEVSASGPGGKGFAVARFDLGDSPDASEAARLGAPTPGDRADDAEMLNVVMQISERMGFTPNASDITLEGTAATDRKQKVDLLV